MGRRMETTSQKTQQVQKYYRQLEEQDPTATLKQLSSEL